MKNKLMYPLIMVVLTACGGDEKQATAQAANYETVQEGSAAGVTSTIAGPGESVPPLTGTNADTTTAFALNPNVAPAAAVPSPYPTGGTLAGTLPAGSYSTPAAAAPAGGAYRQPVTRSAPQRVTRPAASQPATQPMYSSSSTASQSQQQQPSTPAPEPTPAAEPTPAPAPTDTTTTTATQPSPTETAPPAQQPKKKESEQKPPADDAEEGESTETAEPPPPPPAG